MDSSSAALAVNQPLTGGPSRRPRSPAAAPQSLRILDLIVSRVLTDVVGGVDQRFRELPRLSLDELSAHQLVAHADRVRLVSGYWSPSKYSCTPLVCTVNPANTGKSWPETSDSSRCPRGAR